MTQFLDIPLWTREGVVTPDDVVELPVFVAEAVPPLLVVVVGVVPLTLMQTARESDSLRSAKSPASQSEPTQGFQAVRCLTVIRLSEARSAQS